MEVVAKKEEKGDDMDGDRWIKRGQVTRNINTLKAVALHNERAFRWL